MILLFIRPNLFLIWLAFFSFFINSCGTQTGSGLVAIELKSYNAPNLAAVSPKSVSNIKLCFKRLRFKTEGENTSSNHDEDPDNVDFALGPVTLSPAGTSLGNINLGQGTYTRVEFDLDHNCSFGAIEVTNSAGTFRTPETTTLKFEGTFNMLTTNKTLALGIQNIIGALDTVTNSDDIKDAVEAATGDF